MRRAILGFVFLSVSGLGFVYGEKTGSSDENKELKRIEEEEASIWVSRPDDPAALAKANRILGDDYVCLCDGAEVTKRQSIEDFTSGARMEYLKLGEMKVRVFGETAVVTGTDDRKGSYKGQDYSGRYLWTDVLVKRHGRWQEVAAHMCKQ